ncbi:hypothetical protein CAPI_02410 [Corynebacterium capitovis DSM 44611]|uniref:DUF3152 domain-containing protein n=1 Tax=Corynebacterium capitovis TaxID=131081 RepID=UPI00036E9CB9|nr:DUF3152 domain-containing protein [Corynebacterium capitovis]WKD57056.1 hypothetical protein CAPI_02410 [Corynebacterium capitovis DSM 44611]
MTSSPPQDHHGHGSEPFLVRFARDYGWRAYAIPVLAVVTLFVIVDMVRNPGEQAVQVGAAEVTQAKTSGSGESEPAVLPEGNPSLLELPPGGAYTEQGEGSYREVGRPGAVAGTGSETVIRYVVEVENGINASAYGGDDALAALVDATFADPRGWIHDPRFRFERVTGNDNPNLHIQLTSVGTTRELCGGELGLEVSCRTTITGESTVVVNESRWVRGAAPYEGDLGRYRQYVINHEVGHAIGFADHVACPTDGALAPIMMQQTLSLNNAQLHALDPAEVYPDTPETCTANPWPYPRPAVL